MNPSKIVIEYLGKNEWVELITLDIKDPEKQKYEDIEKLVERIQDMFYYKEQVSFQSGDGINCTSVTVRNIDKRFNIFRVKTK